VIDKRGSRRKFLGSAAAIISLPFLPSLVERSASAADCATPLRFLGFFMPCGIHMPDWTPTTTGTDWAMPYILAPLEPLRKKLVVLTGLDHQKTSEPAGPPGGHGSGTGAFLTMRPVHDNADDPNRTSLDQKIATESAACNRPLPSLQLGVLATGDGCDSAPSCSFLETIAWNKNTPLPMVTAPQTAFNRLFIGFDPTASSADAERRQARRTSVLDHVLGEAASLKVELNHSDQLKLDEFTTAVRELEQRIQNAGGAGACQKPAKPTLTDTSPYEQRVPVMLDLAALAFQCDITRSMTFMMARGTSMVDFKFLLGESSPHHTLSHHQNDPATLAKLKEIGRWQIEQFAAFVTRLDAMTEANGKSVLDNSIIYASSEISDGNSHRKYDTPALLVGGAGGKLNIDGSHHMYTKLTFPRPLVGPSGGPHTIKVFVAIQNAFGIADDTFGDGSATGPLPEIVA
jgi:Protein of unknown function (DUF1552)